MEKKFVTDIVGIGYKFWNEGDSIILSTPTGSGKTTFILDTLLEHCAQVNQRILYLVNRSALEKELKEKIRDKHPYLQSFIDVKTYQSIEKEISDLQFGTFYMEDYANYEGKNGKTEARIGTKFKGTGNYSYGFNTWTLKKYDKYNWVICDESHYFFTDSLFNTYTQLSYLFIQHYFRDKFRIFMSATIDETRSKIAEDNYYRKYLRSKYTDFPIGISRSDYDSTALISEKLIDYKLERDYSYIDIEVIGSDNQIPELVAESTQKWVIFVDSTKRGRKLKKAIDEANKEKESKRRTVFVTKDYKNDEETAEEIDSITIRNKLKADILISTSVLDNGINLHDGELRNVIIIADTETEFVQMLGRRRNDGQRVKLYIFKYSREHFNKRFRTCKIQFAFAQEYYKKVKGLLESIPIPKIEKYDTLVKYINQNEHFILASESKKLLQRLIRGEVSFDIIKTCFYELDGILILNPLSMLHLYYQKEEYKKIMKLFDEDQEYAFYKEQLRWLGKPMECLDEALKSSIERSRTVVIARIEKGYIENEIYYAEKGEKEDRNVFTKENWVKLKHSITDDLLEIFAQCSALPDYYSWRSDIRKNERPITGNLMDLLRENCEIPYYVQVIRGKKKYRVIRASEYDKNQKNNTEVTEE